MKRMLAMVILLASMAYFFGANVALAQWPSDPTSNMVLSNLSGAEVIPKIVTTPDGGCYVSWWDNTSGNYDVYAQRLNGIGEIQWAENGLLISHHTQDTWLTDYDMALDSAGYAIIAVNDIRNSADRDIFAYRISPNGDFAWGPDGLAISTGSGFTPDPVIVVTSDGNIVFAWQQGDVTSVINIRKVRTDGSDFWDPPIITLTHTYSLSIPRLAAAENDGFILQYLQAQGSQYYSPKYLLAQKYDANGVAQWPGNGVTISNAGGFGPQMRPDITSDETDGAYSYWYSGPVSTNLHAFAQHISASGSMLWTANGVQLSTNSGQVQFQPALVRVPGTSDVMAFYEVANSDQNIFGLGGQKLDSTGARQWGSGGIIYRPLGNKFVMMNDAVPQEGGAIAIFLESPLNDLSHEYMKALRVDGSGAQIWDPSPIDMGATLSNKMHPVADVNLEGQAIAVWEDYRSDPDGDVILQNINPDGSLGSIVLPYGTLAGTVIDQDSVPLADVIDSVFNGVGGFAGADTTDASGNYSLNLPPDTYIVTFTKHGYMDEFGRVEVIANQITILDEQMFAVTYCRYIPGDANANGGVNGVDIVFAVNYFKGYGALLTNCHTCCPLTPDPFFAALDVNGNCAVNGIDITYFVRYLKGQIPALLFCPSCPPDSTSSCP
jgi:hypothetical protein